MEVCEKEQILVIRQEGRKTFRRFAYFVLTLCLGYFIYLVGQTVFGPDEMQWRILALLLLMALVATLPFVSAEISFNRKIGKIIKRIYWVGLRIFAIEANFSDFSVVAVRRISHSMGGANMEVVGESREIFYVELEQETVHKQKFSVDSFDNDRTAAIQLAGKVSSYLRLPLKKHGF